MATNTLDKSEVSPYRWTLRDVIVMVSISFVFSWVYIGWDFLYNSLLKNYSLANSSLINGMWFLAGFIPMAIIRKPGACVGGESLAALLEVLFAQWFFGGYPINVLGEAYTKVQMPGHPPIDVFNMVAFVGILEGMGPEMVFGFARYKNWGLPLFMAAGAMGAVLEWMTGIWVTHYYLAFGRAQFYGTLVTSVIGISIGAGALSWWVGKLYHRDR